MAAFARAGRSGRGADALALRDALPVDDAVDLRDEPHEEATVEALDERVLNVRVLRVGERSGDALAARRQRTACERGAQSAGIHLQQRQHILNTAYNRTNKECA